MLGAAQSPRLGQSMQAQVSQHCQADDAVNIQKVDKQWTLQAVNLVAARPAMAVQPEK